MLSAPDGYIGFPQLGLCVCRWYNSSYIGIEFVIYVY